MMTAEYTLQLTMKLLINVTSRKNSYKLIFLYIVTLETLDKPSEMTPGISTKHKFKYAVGDIRMPNNKLCIVLHKTA